MQAPLLKIAGLLIVYGVELLLTGAIGVAPKCCIPFRISAVMIGTTIKLSRVPTIKILPCDILRSTMAVSAVPIRVPMLARSAV